ncbi:hypothetical protein ACFVU0_00520 [Streptomyces sp. NPDC058122]|uniref:hypothetical protein n=1 Tax=Streptomyces sp. NPDC058122 TaxID=3346349 RepID=UPI0036EAD2B6
MVVVECRPIAEVAREIQVNEGTLGTWVTGMGCGQVVQQELATGGVVHVRGSDEDGQNQAERPPPRCRRTGTATAIASIFLLVIS